VGQNVFISSHVVVSGYCEIGDYSFLGVNATISNNTIVAHDNLIGAGAAILKNTEPGLIYGAKRTEPTRRVSARDYFNVSRDAD
jgi:carbonic anhydrase/acetyltransferase-like protein (isoleucine patch superfamily)